MIQYNIKCPLCEDAYCHFDKIESDPTILKEATSFFRSAYIIGFLAYCESKKHCFSVFMGQHKGQIQIEVMPLFDLTTREPIIKEK